jgi:hypothetical protein
MTTPGFGAALEAFVEEYAFANSREIAKALPDDDLYDQRISSREGWK